LCHAAEPRVHRVARFPRRRRQHYTVPLVHHQIVSLMYRFDGSCRPSVESRRTVDFGEPADFAPTERTTRALRGRVGRTGAGREKERRPLALTRPLASLSASAAVPAAQSCASSAPGRPWRARRRRRPPPGPPASGHTTGRRWLPATGLRRPPMVPVPRGQMGPPSGGSHVPRESGTAGAARTGRAGTPRERRRVGVVGPLRGSGCRPGLTRGQAVANE
jgi:hypothetical protein